MKMVASLLMMAAGGQGFTLQVGPPVAGNAPSTKSAVFVVRPGDCPEPAAARTPPKHLRRELNVLLEPELGARGELERQALELPGLELQAALRESAKALGQGG